MKNDVDVIKRIVERRAALDWSQNTLATMSGVAPSQISRYETGKSKPSAGVLSKLANAMDVSFEWLKTGNDGVNHHQAKYTNNFLLNDTASIYIEQESERLGISFSELLNNIVEAGISIYKLESIKFPKKNHN